MDTSNAGQHWFSTEDELLLEELNKNIDIKTISQNHKRTLGAINARRRLIAYKMYLEKISIEEIMDKTKFDQKTIREIIDKRYKFKSIENDISEMKNDISEMKNTLNKLVKYLLVLSSES
jgi:hypothetical protein